MLCHAFPIYFLPREKERERGRKGKDGLISTFTTFGPERIIYSDTLKEREPWEYAFVNVCKCVCVYVCMWLATTNTLI